jgi:hypothetical protein
MQKAVPSGRQRQLATAPIFNRQQAAQEAGLLNIWVLPNDRYVVKEQAPLRVTS